jgi:MFS-type transporter involved in bile tolerance (Atg22 family)
MAIGPVGTFALLCILQLHGSVLDIGVATTLFNAITTPGAIFRGFVTDRVRTKKALVVSSYVTVAVVSFGWWGGGYAGVTEL